MYVFLPPPSPSPSSSGALETLPRREGEQGAKNGGNEAGDRSAQHRHCSLPAAAACLWRTCHQAGEAAALIDR